MDSTKALIRRVQAGDEGAFTELMRAHYAFVYAVIIGFVNNPNDAEEIVQDTFLNAYRGLAQYEDREKFKNWLAEIARNSARDWLRKQRVNTVSIDEVSAHTLLTPDAPDEQMIRREQRELIRRAMESLPQKDRDIARSYYLDGASYDELIRTHGLSYKAISFRLSRAKQKLAKRLSHLLTGVFVSPIPALKQIYSGGLTVMKVGTVPKITAGAVAIIVLAFIGTRQFISSKEDSSPSIEIVASSPTEAETSPSQTAPAHKGAVVAPMPEDKPQISAEEMDQIENFFSQLEESDEPSETDTSQLPTDAASDQDSETGNSGPSVASKGTGLSAEDVMNTYVDALRNGNFEKTLPFVTGTPRELIENSMLILSGEIPEVWVNQQVNEALNAIEDVTPGVMSEELEEEVTRSVLKGMAALQASEELARMRKMLSQIEIVSSKYVGDEFHFRLRLPMSDIPGPTNIVLKMRKVDEDWEIYDMTE